MQFKLHGRACKARRRRLARFNEERRLRGGAPEAETRTL